MSDHEETVSDTGYDTPVPELDDHRNHQQTVPRSGRHRRGTFDSLYGSQADHQLQTGFRVRDFEEAVTDDELAEDEHEGFGSRRSLSPPNSVKAFAEARRRERGMSVSEQKQDRDAEHEHHVAHSTHAPPALNRTGSIASRHSHKSRPHTVLIENDAESMSSINSAEEDVCFPVADEHRDDNLHIDFDYLETFMRAEREELEQKEEERRAQEGRTFPDLRSHGLSSETAVAQSPMVTSDGDFVGAPSEIGCISDEKPGASSAEVEAEHEVSKIPARQIDPNRFSFFSSAWESTIHAADFSDLVLPGEDVRGLFTFPKGEADGVWWLNVNNPSEDEARAICRAFGVHPLTVEDITQKETREKIELFPSYYFACFRSFNVVHEADGEVEYVPFHTYVIVFREGTLSFSFEPNSHATKVRTRIALLKDYVALSSDWICYALIDDIVDSFAPEIHDTEMQTEALEDDVFVARTDDMHRFLQKIGTTRRNVMGLMRLLGGKADVLRGFTKRCNENYKVTPRMDIGMYLGDIQDHVVTMMNNLGHCEKMLSRTHSNYLAQLSIDSIVQGTNTNRVLSKITFIASIIVPLNVITGLFGMNVTVPFNGVDNLRAFGGIVGVLVLFCAVSLIFARRMRYI